VELHKILFQMFYLQFTQILTFKKIQNYT